MPPEGLAEEELERLLVDSGSLRSGHFVLSSGLHSPRYVQCALLLADPRRAERVGAALARRLASLRPDSVVSPALGGMLIGHETARGLGVPFRFTERKEGEMRLRRGFALRPGERVVLVEDVVTTGGSVKEAAAVVRQLGARVVGFGAIIDRGAASPFEEPFFALTRLAAEVYDPHGDEPEPPWMSEPIEKPGSRPGS